MPKSTKPPTTRRRQWGSERNRIPLPTVHKRPSDAKIVWGRIAVVITVTAWILYVITTIARLIFEYGNQDFRLSLEAIFYLVVVTFLTFSALMYLVARQGALRRFRDHVRVPRAELDRHFAEPHLDGMTVLVPSYAEEPSVVRKTLWSAALQEYPGLHLVLLLDDPPAPTDPYVAYRLDATRRLTNEIAEALIDPSTRFSDALFAFESGLSATGTVSTEAVSALAGEYDSATRWLRDMAAAEEHEDHVDTFFIDEVLGGLADDLELTGRAIEASLDGSIDLTSDRMLELHRRLVWIFTVETATFERKKYASLSHEANKAMNLNAYIGLMGGRFRTELTPDGPFLRPVTDAQQAELVVPNAQYLLTLDADSLLLRDYCLRLVYLLEQPDNERVAVTQTPYSAFRGSPTRIERLAGATTDLQHILHQGLTEYNATFWVGANAVIRMEALDDILEIESVGAFEVRRYVQDRTVIEDTESSIDLAEHGWTLVNYPERLSYSATPPDFGSLIVQRRRWANGGLLILPKFLRQLKARKRAGIPVRWLESMLRVNYMASISWASVGLVFLLVYPYDSRLLSPLVLVAALPYFIAQTSDLRACGYKFADIFRIYGFNLILLPVNLAGVVKSVEQSLTGKKIPFARTPKVRNRTASPLLYVVAPYVIVAFSVFTVWRNVVDQNWGNAAFAAFNAMCAAWAIVDNIGVLNSLVDIWLGLTDWMWVDRKRTHSDDTVVTLGTDFDWQTALYHGHAPAGSGDRNHRVKRKKPSRRTPIVALAETPDHPEPIAVGTLGGSENESPTA
ncbi:MULTISPECIES: glycosyltransferase family 2 protein [Subtercola]|uniref:Glycosyltransferase n=1 Tax=Subtercola vilae TaxID=2056433 RepID=A0A4T2C916_9MICO|nr:MULTISPECIES: glycosyltransferase family 2 protein [Subtercola]MEA9983974.1 glycosyltransferase family 2 protein [Subtercola sp. RTI3]TIH40955.1 glycosyltransferase [Subtercola vilae]